MRASVFERVLEDADCHLEFADVCIRPAERVGGRRARLFQERDCAAMISARKREFAESTQGAAADNGASSAPCGSPLGLSVLAES